MSSHVILNSSAFAPDVARRPRRGEANALRKGQPKIHRRYTPVLSCPVPRGMAAKVVARLGSHDWNRNPDLVELRRAGYVPYTRRRDAGYQPKPMRISTRSESREALTALSLALAANCDYNPDSDYPFEIMMPFEQVAAAMGVLHQYESGRKSYDVALHALSVQEQLGYVIALHSQDSDSGQNKPMRLWLSEKFFTSRGIAVEEIRQWLGQFKRWAVKNGLTESLRRKYEQHLLRIERIGIDLKSRHSLRNRLKQLKRWVFSPDLAPAAREKMAQLRDELAGQDAQRLDIVLDETATVLRQRRQQLNGHYQAWIKWSTGQPTLAAMQLENALKQEQPGLLQQDPESFYRQLLERAGVFKV